MRQGGLPGHQQPSNWSRWWWRQDTQEQHGGSSQEDQAHGGRKDPLQRVSYEEGPEVLARDSNCLQDPPVSNEY